MQSPAEERQELYRYRPTSRDTVLALFVALFLFGVYMVTFDGTLHSTDGLSMFAIAENIVKHGRFDTRQLENWENVYLGINELPYTNFAVGPPLLMTPFIALALAWPHLGLIQTTMVLMPLSSALTAIYIYLSSRRLQYSPKIGLVAALLTGLATMAWLRTRDLVADPLMLLSFTATFYYALAYRQDKNLKQAAFMGLALSITVLHKAVNIIAVPLFFWYLASPSLTENILQNFNLKKVDWQAMGLATGTWTSCLLIIGGYNWVRFGNPLDTGYPSLFTTPPWIGFAGYLVSPYKSIFLYIPLFMLIPFTIKRVGQKHPRELILILVLLFSQMIIFGAWYDWGGGRTWGPRFLVPLNGLLLLLLLPYIARAFQPGQYQSLGVLAIFSLISLLVQIIGISARDNVYLDAPSYWKPPPEFSFWGELSWNNPAQWPIWGHLLVLDIRNIPVIWHWQWQTQSHFDLLSLLAALAIVTIGLAGMLTVYRFKHPSKLWALGSWGVALVCVILILWRSYNDSRSMQEASEARKLWADYSTLVSQLPELTQPEDAIIFTDRRFEFYLLDMDKSLAQRYVIAKHTQPIILETVPHLLRQQAEHGRIWLVTDNLNNRQLAYATELWLARYAQVDEHYLFGDSVQLIAYKPYLPTVAWAAIPPEPLLSVVVKPDDYTFNKIASLLGWNWPEFDHRLPPTLEAGEVYSFELYWIYRGKAPEDLFFVRLLDESGQMVFETFTTPRADNRLIPGQLLVEDATLDLPADIASGTYHLQIGFTIPVVETGELTFSLPAELTVLQVVQTNEATLR